MIVENIKQIAEEVLCVLVSKQIYILYPNGVKVSSVLDDDDAVRPAEGFPGQVDHGVRLPPGRLNDANIPRIG